MLAHEEPLCGNEERPLVAMKSAFGTMKSRVAAIEGHALGVTRSRRSSTLHGEDSGSELPAPEQSEDMGKVETELDPPRRGFGQRAARPRTGEVTDKVATERDPSRRVAVSGNYFTDDGR